MTFRLYFVDDITSGATSDDRSGDLLTATDRPPDGELRQGGAACVGGVPVDATDPDRIAYVADMVAELRDMACAAGLRRLGLMLTIAHEQALDDSGLPMRKAAARVAEK